MDKNRQSQLYYIASFALGIVVGYGLLGTITKERRQKEVKQQQIVKHVRNKNDKVAFVTGAASGIGKATTLRFVRDGYYVVGVDLDANALKELENEIGQKERFYWIVADVGVEQDVCRAVQDAVSRFGHLDVCFNNAGIEGNRSKICDLSLLSFEKVLRVNLVSQFLCMKYEIQQMIKQQQNDNVSSSSSGSSCMIDRYNFAIINTSSTAVSFLSLFDTSHTYTHKRTIKGLSSMPEFSAYCASKFGIIGLTRCVAKEYASRGIRVNSICPSTTNTPMVARFSKLYPEWQKKQNASFPVGRIADPEEIANAVLWLASTSCRFLTGTELVIDGGARA